MTLDVANSTITGNTFSGTTTRFGTSFRVRRPGTVITGNTFNSSGLTPTTGHIYFENATFTTGGFIAANSFDKAVYGDPNATSGVTVGISINSAVGVAPSGSTINVAAGTYNENVTINTSLTLSGANFNTDPNTVTRGSESVLNGTFYVASIIVIDGFKITGAGGAVLATGSGPWSNISISNNIMESNTGQQTIAYGFAFGHHFHQH